MAASGAELLEATSLTHAYNLAEHHAPDCVVIDETLANLAEFELLASLLRLMKIDCFVVTHETTASRTHPIYRDIQVVEETALAAALKKPERDSAASKVSDRQDNGRAKDANVFDRNRLILIGASTGGIDALLTITRHFDRQSPPVLIVQHTGGTFAKSLIRLIDGASSAAVLAAEDGMPVEAGHVYLAPDDQSHLTLSPTHRGQIALLQTAPLSGHRPSVDALFASAIRYAGHVSAALLTGMGRDGAEGLTKLRQAGAFTIGQDERTSVVYGMPRIAMEMGGVCAQLALGEIGPALLASSRMRQKA